MQCQPIGILLAAGRGRRMGCVKQLLPWPKANITTTLVEAAFDSIADVCQAMVVVAGSDSDAIQQVLLPRQFTLATSDSDAEMIDSLRQGLTTAQTIDPAAPILLQLGDHPHVAQSTCESMCREFETNPSQVIIPEYQGRGGHPILMPADVSRMIMQTDMQGGLRNFWRNNVSICRRIRVDDPTVVQDLDTPEDYEG